MLDDYASSLENAGATVEQVPTGKIDCVLMSQLIRLFAFRHPKVRDGDVVTTMDVNAFVMTPSILDPLREFPHLRVWVFQYHETVHLQGVKGKCQMKVTDSMYSKFFFFRFQVKLSTKI